MYSCIVVSSSILSAQRVAFLREIASVHGGTSSNVYELGKMHLEHSIPSCESPFSYFSPNPSLRNILVRKYKGEASASSSRHTLSRLSLDQRQDIEGTFKEDPNNHATAKKKVVVVPVYEDI